MLDSALTRRSFLATGVAVGAAAFGGVGVGGLRDEAFAWGEDHVVEYAATICDGCGNKCGMGASLAVICACAVWDTPRLHIPKTA